MNPNRKKYLLNIIGSGIVILWMIMIGLLVKKVGFADLNDPTGSIDTEISDIDHSQRDWMDIFLKDKKVGYSMNQITPFEEGFIIREEICLKLNLMGNPGLVRTVTKAAVDQGFRLKDFKFRMTSGIITFEVSGKVDGKKMIIETGQGTNRRSEIVKLEGPLMIGAGISPYLKGKTLEVGQAFKFRLFDPSVMAQKETSIRVIANEEIIIKGTKYSAFKLETEMFGRRLIFWLDESGDVLKEEGFMGFTLVKSDAAGAPLHIEDGGGEDFYELSAIDVKTRLKDAENLTNLVLQVEGIDESMLDITILDEGRQRFREGVLAVNKEKIPLKPSYRIPYPEPSGAMKSVLQPELCIESDERLILEKARAIAGDSKDPVVVAKDLMSWVYKNLTKRPVVTVPSALEVLKTRVGDCNEHAVLLTALLRASGIPARICVGLAYSRDKFFYHAWNECYVGEWISIDATLNQMPVDAAHIKLVEGGLDKQIEIIGLIGRIKLEVIGFKND